jgi:hypothetical protein
LEFNQETWNEFIKDCKYLSKHLPEHTDTAGGYYKGIPLNLGGCYKYKNAQFNKNQVWFNGSTGNRILTKEGWQDIEDVRKEQETIGHETFAIQRKRKVKKFEFCKTAGKPYDLMVCTCLILLKWYFKDKVSISSDGDMEDWQPAFDFVLCNLKHGEIVVVETKLSDFFGKN